MFLDDWGRPQVYVTYVGGSPPSPHIVIDLPIGTLAPGKYPAAFRARLLQGAGFLLAEESTADLVVEQRVPTVTWPSPGPIRYGTPLGDDELNATADASGQYFY